MREMITCTCGGSIHAHWQVFEHVACRAPEDVAQIHEQAAKREAWRLEKLRGQARRQLERLRAGKMSKIEAFKYGKKLQEALQGRT